MRKYVLAAVVLASAMPAAPAIARQVNGYTVRPTVMRAGPEYDYPAVQRLRPNSMVIVYGCLRDWSWCDVSNRYDRGWVSGDDIVVNYQGRRGRIVPSMGIGILSFVFGTYWDSHYRSRPFYSERPRWETQYNTNFRPEWGNRPRGPSGEPPRHRPGFGGQTGPSGTMQDRQSYPQGQPGQHRIVTPVTPPVGQQGQASQQERPRIMRHQINPGQVAPTGQTQGNPAVTSVKVVPKVNTVQPGATGQHNQHKPNGQQGDHRDNGDKGHRPQD